MIIGITGLLGAGKDTAADILQTMGFEHYSLSDEIRKVLKKKNILETIENLTKEGEEIKKKFGFAELARRARSHCLGKNCVLTSIRMLPEVGYLQKQPDFYFWTIDCPAKIRYQRTKKRNRPSDNFTSFADFCEKESKQTKGKGAQINLSETIALADLVIKNDKDIKTLKRRVNEAVQKLPEN